MTIKKISGQVTGGTRNDPLTVASSRTWRGSEASAAPDLPGRRKHTPRKVVCQLTANFKRISYDKQKYKIPLIGLPF
jgi:hypothetical protein